jgi:hypothetical protein
MALESAVDISIEHRQSLADRPDTSPADKQTNILTEATSERDVRSGEKNASDDTGDSGNVSDNGGRMKLAAKAVLAGVSYDFGQSKVTRARISTLENSFRFFSKGFARPPDVESVPDPKENEVVVFEDFFTAGLCIPPHPILLDILHKFQVQLHQLMPNTIIQISMLVWAVTSCGGCPNAEIFAHHYELHCQNKKIHLVGSDTTFPAQFVCITFHPSRFGHRARLTATTWNKWTSGWDNN